MIYMDLSRTKKVFANIENLKSKHVAIFGLGGVGGYVAEALVRSGVGEITVVDGDVVEASNINRQIIALSDNIGQPKVDAISLRLKAINPDVIVHAHNMFFLPENSDVLDFSEFDFVADAVDTVAAKVELVTKLGGKNIISCMGTGNRTDPTAVAIGDVFKTQGCPLAEVMRSLLRKKGINKLTVVYSTELPIKTSDRTPGSTAFVPGAAGLAMAGFIVKSLLS